MKRFLTAFACGVLLATGVAACGDDDKASETTPTVTTETETTPTTETVPTATTPPPATAAPDHPHPAGGPRTRAGPPPRAPRRRASPRTGRTTTCRPSPGSPAERFEQQCEQNPQTCGD